VVFEYVIQCAVDTHRACNRVIGYCARYTAARSFVHFVDSTHVNGFAVIGLDFLHQIAIAIIDKLRRLSTDGDRDQAVLGIERLSVGQATFDARDNGCVCSIPYDL